MGDELERRRGLEGLGSALYGPVMLRECHYTFALNRRIHNTAREPCGNLCTLGDKGINVGSSFATNEPSGGGLTLGEFVVGDGGYVRILWEFPSWCSGNESN